MVQDRVGKRARRRKSIRDLLLVLFVSHHPPDQHDRCWRLPIGRSRSLPVCARCSGIYPIAIALLIPQLMRPAALDLSWTDPWLILLGPLPAVVEFLAENLSPTSFRGSNFLRSATGVPLGIALSRMFARYFADVGDPFFWGVVAGYGGICTLVAGFALRKRLQAP